MPTLDDLARKLTHRTHTVRDIARVVFDPQTAIGHFRNEQLTAARSSLIEFAKVVDPQFRVNWHHELIAAHLEQLDSGEIQRLMVLTPPRHGKTLLCSHMFPAWVLGRHDEHIVGAAYNKTKASDEAQAVKAILDSDAYRAVFPLARIPQRTNEGRGELRRAGHFNLIGRPRAVYRAAGIGSGLTGYTKTLGLIDDPIKSLEEAYSEKFRDKNWGWYSGVYRSRDTHLAARNGVRDLLVQTPWHEDDLHGRILQHEPEWHVLRLPAILTDTSFEDRDADDPRAIDTALWPDMWPLAELEKFRRTFPTTFQALFQCRPSSAEGRMFRRDMFPVYGAHDLPRDAFYQLSVDATFGSTKETASYVAIQLWAFSGNKAFLVHAWRGHWTFPVTVAQIEACVKLYPQTSQILIEEKANGAAILQMLKDRIGYSVVSTNPNGSKVARAAAISPWVEAGCVLVPSAESVWRTEFLGEVCAFPRGKNNDHVDAMSQALVRLSDNPLAGSEVWDVWMRQSSSSHFASGRRMRA